MFRYIRARSMSLIMQGQYLVQNTPKKKWHLLLNFLPEQKRLKQLISFQVWQVTEGLLITLKTLNCQTNFFEGLKNYYIWVAFFIATTVCAYLLEFIIYPLSACCFWILLCVSMFCGGNYIMVIESTFSLEGISLFLLQSSSVFSHWSENRK